MESFRSGRLKVNSPDNFWRLSEPHALQAIWSPKNPGPVLAFSSSYRASYGPDRRDSNTAPAGRFESLPLAELTVSPKSNANENRSGNAAKAPDTRPVSTYMKSGWCIPLLALLGGPIEKGANTSCG